MALDTIGGPPRRSWWRHPLAAAVCAVFAEICLLSFLLALSASKAGEIAGALGSILGGIIAAIGVAAAVYLTLSAQRREDRARIGGAIVREVMEFSRFILIHLETYLNISSGGMELPGPKLIETIVIPPPTIYPAIADRIGLLTSAQKVVAFYCRISEITMLMVPAIANNREVELRFLNINDVRALVEQSLIVLVFARDIIEGSSFDVEFDEGARKSILSDMEIVSERARQTFEVLGR